MATQQAAVSIRTEKTGQVTAMRSWHADTVAEARSVGGGSFEGYAATGERDIGNWDPNDIGMGYQVDVHYSGIDREVADRVTEEDPLWSLDRGYGSKPIEAHPAIEKLKELYEGKVNAETNQLEFPATLSEAKNQQRFRQRQGQTGAVPNPLHGIAKSGYLVLEGVASAQYVTDDLSGLENAEGVYESLPGNAPSAYEPDDDRNWLALPPIVREISRDPDSGSRSYSVELAYLLSEKGGWPTAVYLLEEFE